MRDKSLGKLCKNYMKNSSFLKEIIIIFQKLLPKFYEWNNLNKFNLILFRYFIIIREIFYLHDN